jgi:hypothetical protein
MPKHVGVELERINNKNPLLQIAFVGLLTYDTTRCSVKHTHHESLFAVLSGKTNHFAFIII